jgi:aspartyl-tRNA(Asn)/glutamyl-tRNA(Gln) amidotransferase subunit A
MSASTDEALTRVDALLCPTSPTVAFTLGARAADPLAMYLSDIFTAPACLTGHPALSLPCGLSEGLPVGLHLTARRWEEDMAFRLAGAVERQVGLLRPGAA